MCPTVLKHQQQNKKKNNYAHTKSYINSTVESRS